MAIDVLGSRMRADAYYGQGASAQPSSIRKGETIKRSQVAESILASDVVKANPRPDANWQMRDVKPDAGVPVHPASRSRGEGGTVPKSLNYGREGKR
jgi:hypothetical protein